MDENKNTLASFHRISGFLDQTTIILSASQNLLNTFSHNFMKKNDNFSLATQRIHTGDFKKFVFEWAIENAFERGDSLRIVSDRIAAVDLVVAEKKSDFAYFTAIFEILIALEEAQMADIIVDSKWEEHFVAVFIERLSAHANETGKLKKEIANIFDANKKNLLVDLIVELEKVIDRFELQGDSRNIRFDFHRPRYLLPLLDLDVQRFRRILILLLENGIKYTGDMYDGKTPWIDIYVEEFKEAVHVRMENWGPPIFRHEEDRVIEKGVRGSAVKFLEIQGHGQGLFQAVTLAEQIGISLGVRTKNDVDEQSWTHDKKHITVATIKIPKVYTRTR